MAGWRPGVARVLQPAEVRQSMPRSLLARLWSHRWQASAIIAALVIIGYLGGPILLGPVVTADPVVRADFVQTVVASGHVEAPFRINIGSQITGIVASVPVAEGQSVKAGDPLIILDDREARASVAQAEGVVAGAEARMRQMRELVLPQAQEALKQYQATLLDAQQTYERASKLAKDGYGTIATLDEATKSLDVARAQVRNAEFQIYTNQPGGSDYVMAETLLNQARANLVTAQSRLSYTVIVAPRDGILISRDVERGDVVQPSNLLMKLSPVGDTELVVQIDEKNLASLAIGQNAIVSADAFPKQTFSAKVVYINPGIDLQRASVEVKLRVPDPPSYLRQDMTVSVDIVVARRPRTLVVPVADVRDIDGPNPWVLKVDSGRAKRQRVNVGLVSSGKAEILEGLSENELVIPTTAASIKDGSQVRARIAARGPTQ